MNGKCLKNVRNYDVVRFIRVRNFKFMIVVTFMMHTHIIKGWLWNKWEPF